MRSKKFVSARVWQYSLVLFAIVGAAVTASADEPEEPTRIILHPAAEPTPVLKYRLLPEFIDRKPGNAAVFYGKVTAERRYFFSNKELWENMRRWRSAPLTDLLTEKAKVPLKPRFLRQAALCRSCDWQLTLHEGRYFGMLLPEVQQTREFGRILATQARIYVARGEFAQAIESFQTGLALARHVAAGETLVHGLIGVAISKEVLKQATEFVQQPDAPNLYWAITMLPRPFIDMHDGLEAEMSIFELSFPELRDLETKHLSPEEWQKLLQAFCYYFALLSDQDNDLGRMAIYAKMIGSYPAAKQTLIQQGMTAKEVESMPKEQVVSLHTLRTFKRLQQDVNKYFHLPYPAAIDGMASAVERVENEQSEIARIIGATRNTRKALARNTRRFEVLRVIEALRIYAAAHEGNLPKKLEDVTEVPIPIDPVTGKAFEYRREGDVATLRGPALLDESLNYEITMKKP